MTEFCLRPSHGRLDEAANAFWPTPAWTTHALLDAHQITSSWVIEPSAGQGAIAEVLKQRDHQVVAVELRDECWMALSDILCSSSMHEVVIGDWLSMDPSKLTPPMVEFSIIGNPPYNPADQMLAHVRHAVESSAKTVAMLLPTNFLHSRSRARFHADHPVNVVYALSRRPTTHPEDKSRGGMRDLSWFVWERGAEGQRIEVIA